MLAKLHAYKNIVLFLLSFFFVQVAISQTNTWDGSTDNNWNTAANWSLNVVPTRFHNVVISTGASITFTGNPGIIKSLTISNSATVILSTTGSPITVRIANPNQVGFNIEAGSSLSLNGATGGTMGIVYYGSNNIANIAGSLIIAGTGNGGFYSTIGGVTTVTGTLSYTKGKLTTSETSLVFGDGGSYVHNINGGFVPLATWDPNSNLVLPAITDNLPNQMDQFFGNIFFQSALTKPLLINADWFLNGSLTIANIGTANHLILNTTAVDHTLFIGGNFVLNSGAVDLVKSTGAGNLEIGGSFILNGGNFVAKDAPGSVNVNVFGNLEITGGTLLQRKSGVLGSSVFNVFTHFIQTGGLYNMNQVSNQESILNLGGNFEQTGGTLTETGAGTSNGKIFFNGFVQEFTSGGINPPGAIINYTVNENVVLQFTGTSTTVKGAGTFTNLIGSTLGIKHPQGISVTGATGHVQVTGTRTYATGANYIYNGITDQVTGSGLTQNTPNFLTIDNIGNTVSLSAPTVVASDLLIQNGTLSAANGLASHDLTVGGEWVNFGNFVPGNAKVVLNGAGIQSISGDNPTTFNVLELAKTTGYVFLGQDITVNSALNIDVILDVSGFNLTMGNTAQAIGVLTGTFGPDKMIVSSGGGEVRKNATSAAQATYAFPIGDIEGTPEYSPVGIVFTGGSYNGYVGVKVVDAVHPNNLNITDYLTRYWSVTQSGFSGFTAQAGFVYVDDDIVGTETEIRLGQWTGAEPWIRFDPSSDPSINIIGTLALTEFGDFTGLSATEALPIHFGSIRGWSSNNRDIQVEWKVLGETGTSHYEIEKLVSANNFVKIGSQNAGNSGLDVTYTFTDQAPSAGDNFYRIKGIELTGEITYSPVVRVKINSSGAREIKIYPNPVKGNNLAISLQNFKAGKYEMIITNNLGQVLISRGIDQPAGNSVIQVPLNSAMAAGIYRLRITNGEDTYISSFIKE